MNKKNLSWIFVFLLLVVSVNALTIISPLNNSNITYNTTLNYSRSGNETTAVKNIEVYFNTSLIKNTTIGYNTLSHTAGYINTLSYILAYNQSVGNEKLRDAYLGTTIERTRGYSSSATIKARIKYNNGSLLWTNEVTSSYTNALGGEAMPNMVTNILLTEKVQYIEYWITMSYVSGPDLLLYTTVYTDTTTVKDFNYNISWYSYITSLGIYNLTINAMNYTGGIIDQNISQVNVLSNALLNITAYNYTGSALTTFNATINGIDYATTTGVIYYPAIIGNTFNITIKAIGYAHDIGTIQINTTNTLYNRTLYPAASILIYIYDEDTLALITENITVTLTDITNPRVITSSTVSGNITFLNLTMNGDIYEVKFTSVNYSDSRVYRTIVDTAYELLNVYLLKNSVAKNFTMCFYNTNSQPIINLHVYQNFLSNTSYLLSQDLYTNILGKVEFSYNDNKYYYYNISSSTYIMNPFILNPPDNSVVTTSGCNYEITLGETTTNNIIYYGVNVTGIVAYSNTTKILNFSYISGNTTYTNYSYTVSKYLNGIYNIICSGSSALTSSTFNCNTTGYSGNVYVQGVVDNNIFYGGYTDLGGVTTIPVDQKDGAFLAGILLLIIVLGTATFGVIGALISLVIAFLLIMWLGFLTIITGTIVIVVGMISVIIAFGLKGRK